MSGYPMVKIEKGAYENDSCPTGFWQVACSNSGVTESITGVGKVLCEWFYGVLPTQMHQNYSPFNELASNYFTENVHLDCTYNINGHNQLDCTGVKTIIWVLYGIFKDENLRFSPNLQFGGLKTEHDRHGIITVKVSGTVHKDSSYLGVFDHTFQLVRCPHRGGFRIKSVELNMNP